MADKTKRRDLSLNEKIEILNRYDKLPKMSQRNAAVQLNVSQPLLCKILKNRSDVEEKSKRNNNLNVKRNRCGKDGQVESALKQWFISVRERDVRVDGPLMRQKAEDLAKKMGKNNFVATEGWFHRWKKRENIDYRRIHGEQKDADVVGAENWIENEWKKIADKYSPDNVYNADETSLYFRALFDHANMFSIESSKGCKMVKERITILCCASMAGDKKKLLVIGKRKNPRCFKGITNLPVDYYANSNACMTNAVFNEWLIKWDNSLTNKIALLVDNSMAVQVTSHLKNIEVIFLLANTASLIQPCDQGIIRTMKAYYRKQMRERILENMENEAEICGNELAKKTNLLDAIHLINMSWNKVSRAAIKNCYKHRGFLYNNESEDELEEAELLPPPDITSKQFEEWMAIDENIAVIEKLTDDEICRGISEDAKEEATEEEQEEAVEPVTYKDVINSLNILRRYVQQNSKEFIFHYSYEEQLQKVMQNNLRRTTL